MKLLLVAGARPNFMKIAPIIRALSATRRAQRATPSPYLRPHGGEGNASCTASWKLVHTGQHYDDAMSQSFFDDLGIPEPDYFLNAGSGSHAVQTAKVMVEFEKVCVKERPDVVIVVGDVNSTLACAIVAKKCGSRLAHVEAGLRSDDMRMPEEINRIVTDRLADYLFVTEESGLANLAREGAADARVHFVGNVMIDTLRHTLASLDSPSSLRPHEGPYAVLTLHRPSNVDDRETLEGILQAIEEISRDMAVVFPAHPRTRNNIESFGFTRLVARSGVTVMPPLAYRQFLGLWRDAALVLTDSGGIQEETTALGIPCFTIRDNTERPITIEEGTNTLVGTMGASIMKAYNEFKAGKTKKGRVPALWDGKAAERIVNVLMGETNEARI
ncbi:MAG: UDP-N-acetylglucosamine 2-epimerase (non-hydrolyzing) [Candidatus Latescibacterota bacterium]